MRLGALSDPAEREADQVADQVLLPAHNKQAHVLALAPTRIQRHCDCESDEDGERDVQAKQEPSVGRGSIPAGFEARFASLQSTGRPLAATEQAFFGSRFSHRFDSVRLHDSPAAGELALSVGARAFTLGTSIVFGPGQLAPTTPQGRHLLAHELTHVVQQASSASHDVRRESAHTTSDAAPETASTSAEPA